MEIKPAFDTALEEEIIGSMIYDPACIAEIADFIKPEYFYHRQYQLLYEHIIELWQDDETRVHLVEMAPFLQKHGIDIAKLNRMMGAITTTATIVYHATRLRDLWALREAMKVGYELIQAGHLRDRDDIKEAIGQAEAKLAKITDTTASTETMTTMMSALMEFSEEFDELYHKGEGIVGLSTGFKDLDLKTTGLKNADFIVIGGRSSMGKTAFALQLARNISVDQEKPVLFFSLEMSKKSLVRRMLASEAMINIQKMNSGLIQPDEYERYTEAMGILSRAQLVIDDQPGLTVADMKAKARRMKRERGLSCIIIDYLQYVRGSGRQERYLELGEITSQLKGMAKEFDIPVIALAQLSRGVDQRQDKRPVMSDLRESGNIEQDADLIMLLYRDEYYNPQTEKKNIVEVIIGKQRNGPTGVVELGFFKETNRFFDVEKLKNRGGSS
ncbi:replicative DNA helicase [Lihuaxuella thermophila]|uniref:Replicative DNA helicase n=1 Tax=Lihuaxuella thermophila TaxID=1173111 RepID=A0A1H8HAU7_9BACL|nr:replicative DNA helicase [Lihuaxuella thermophila]SEN53295.1 replicative DNA helicase [Lihuaxuella thermophila]SEN78272.1 replicative DNA helicase [Lihuaxuella thermophila]SEN80281.1 replicative DNA helicase [Lihuaxuella thermophila]